MLTLNQTKSLLLSFVILCTVTLNGCASINEEILIQKAVYRTYAVTSEQAWEISKAIFRGAGYGVIENDLLIAVIAKLKRINIQIA